MVFVREIKKGARVYRYRYESKRINGKVKSIYLGKEIVNTKSHKKKVSHKVAKDHKTVSSKLKLKDDKWIIDKIIEFDNLMEETNLLIVRQKIEDAAKQYHKLLDLYDKLSEQISETKKIDFYNKTKEIYDKINDFSN